MDFLRLGIPFKRGRGDWENYWATRTPADLVLTVLSDTSIKADWTDAAEAADGLKVYFNDVLKDTVAFGVGTSTVTGLIINTTYTVDVVAYKGTHESSAITDSATTFNPFITTWDTEKAGSATKTIVVPTTDAGYDCYIDWGEGGTEEHKTGTPGNITHVYATTGTKTIKIRGTFPHIYFNNSGDKLKLLTVAHWGSIAWASMVNAFYGCANLTGTYTDIPDTAAVTSMAYMFCGCSAFNQSVANFNTATVTNMACMFYNCSAFNQSVANFNTAAVTSMAYMFSGCSAFNQSVANFDTAAVANMTYMFSGCKAFNQSVANFNTAAVTNMACMFYNCSAFNQSVANFNTAAVTSMAYMFCGCSAFNQSVANFNTAAVTSMAYIFYNCTAFNQNVANFNTAAVKDMSYMFCYCSAFNQSVANFNTAAVTSMAYIFYNCTAFNQNVANFNTAAVKDMSYMFCYCSAFKQSLAAFVLTAITNMTNMFYGCDINATGTSTNYDNTLIAWADADVPDSMNFNAGTSKYGAGAGLAARASLIADDLWTITDGGQI